MRRKRVQDCVELGLVCAYQKEAQVALARYALEPLFENEIHEAVSDDLRKTYVPWRAQLALYDFVVFYGVPEPLQISESPIIDWRVRAKPAQPFLSMPLGPSALLVGTASAKKSRAAPVLWKTAVRMGPFADHNRLMAEAARSWLVATSDDQLVKVQEKVAPR
jgi:hypothetical protein